MPGYLEAARALDERVTRPLRALLGNTRRLYLAPDGMLGLVPFAALVDEDGDYLVSKYQFTYLTSGRDLIHMRELTAARSGALVIADPDYQHATAGESNLQFDPLPGTAKEADVLAAMFDDVTALHGSHATESALAIAAGPRMFHLATHGFFLEDLGATATKAAHRGIQVRLKQIDTDLASPPPLPQNPLLRSGLALAGANARDDGHGDDGILTALEAANLDLHGTKLVVLSACDTGVGDVVNGDGVYGLRRAFVVAGAETVVMSLWQVDDAATRELMVGYYQRLVAGEGRVEAMRQVQLAMLRDPKTAHPYYWASFIVSGNPDTLDGQPAPLPRFGRGPRGCGCRAGDPGGTPSVALLVLAVLAATRRRRSREVVS